MRQFFSGRRPSPALVVAVVALVAALGGTAVALPGKRTVKRDDIATNAVGKRAIGKRAVGGSELRRNTVGSAKTRNNSLTGDDVEETTFGPVPNAVNAGNAANVGPNGVDTAALQDDAVTSAKLGAVTRRTASTTVNAGTQNTVTRQCEPGEVTLGGGAEINAAAADAAEVRLMRSRPFTAGNGGWTARAYNTAAPNKSLSVYALCLTP